MNINDFDSWLSTFLMSVGYWGYLLCCILIVIESIIPILPLSVFISLIFYGFGSVLGFIISYAFTIIGSFMSYKIFNSSLRIKFESFINSKDRHRLRKLTFRLRTIRFEKLTLIIALPFTPAFLVNIGAGLSNMNKKKYFYALLIGKVFLVIFWGFIGTSLINSIKKPINLIIILVLLLICFIVSRFVNKKEGIE